ncbi:fas-binding factor 1 isoform X2 [Eublepharis macularius]|nr:fas-binding factor 1 isoform X2 [Eublepharis macularius]
MSHEKEAVAEDPDISDVDPDDLLETLKDMDAMEADLLGIKKTNSGPIQKPIKDAEKSQPLIEPAVAKKAVVNERGDSVSGMDKKPSTVAATSKQLKQKLSFEDIDDPLAGLLSDEEEDMVKKVYSSGIKSSPETNAGTPKEKGTPLPATPGRAAVAPERKKEELVFEDDGHDLMDALGFGDSSKAEMKAGRKGEEGEPRPARSMLDELLGRGTATKPLERPSIGEAKEFKLDKKYKKQADKEDIWGDEFTFGAYQPTVASAPEGRQSRRQSVRFSSENLSELKTDQRSKPSTPVSASPIRSKAGADWLGLKDEDFDSPPPSLPKEFSKGNIRGGATDMSHSPSNDEHPLPTRSKPAIEERTQNPEPTKDDGDSWLSNILSQKKSQAQEKVEEEKAEPPDPVSYGEEVAPVPLSSHPATSTQKQSSVHTHRVPTLKESGPSMTLLNAQEQAAPVVLSSSRKGTPFGDIIKEAPVASLQRAQEELQIPAVTQDKLLHSEHPPLCLPSTSENEKKLARVQAQLRESVASYQAELLSAQTRLAELEGQVRRLELEKHQQKLLLESLQQRYQDDLELVENAHRNRLKVIEDSYRQREEHFRQENQELAERYLSHCQSAEQAKSELLAQHQRRLTEVEQEKVKEIDRLRELQRLSILQMQKDHEEQLQRLKRLKDQEIDAVTSATSYTRSLNSIIDQMEQFSSNLNDLSSKVEATHHTTSQGLEIGTRQREEQHRVLQDRLARQQRDMEEERGRLQAVISKMEARLNEQTRLLEQERWRVTGEQSKAASLQHSLEEQRRVMTQQLAMEREELERAKNALLEEQKSVMQKCAEERHKLAMEWSEFHTQQRLSKERTEREVDRALQIDSQREGAIMSLAKEQADLKIRANELRSKEEQLAREQEILEQEKQQLRLEKERVNAAALNIKQRAEEIESMSKLSSQRYEEGEQALLEARKIESEHQARLRAVQQQMERLRQQEEYLHQERLNLSHQRRQLEQLRDNLPSNPLLFQTTSQMPLSGAQANLISNLPYLPAPATDLPKVDLGNSEVSQDLLRMKPTDLYAKLVLHKLTADRDNDFLEEERFFLDTLKKASYKTSSQTV